jgi:hypothetical protein
MNSPEVAMKVGNKGAVLIGLALAAWPGCASQKSTLERQSDATRAAQTRASAAAEQAQRNAPLSASEVATARRFLCGRAREQLEALESETARVAHRLLNEGTEEQRAEWGPVLIDIEHDRQLFAEGLVEAEHAPLENWAENHAILPSMIDIFMVFGAQAMTAIEQDLDGLMAPAHDTYPAPRGS